MDCRLHGASAVTVKRAARRRTRESLAVELLRLSALVGEEGILRQRVGRRRRGERPVGGVACRRLFHKRGAGRLGDRNIRRQHDGLAVLEGRDLRHEP